MSFLKRFSWLALWLIPYSTVALSSPHLTPQDPQNVNTVTVAGSLENQGYELKRVSYTSVSGRAVSKDLYFVATASGAQAAYQNAGLSYNALQEVLQDLSTSVNFSQRTSTSSSMVNATSDTSVGMMIILDKEAEAISSQAQADAYIAKWGLVIDNTSDDTFDAETLSSEYGSSCPRKWKCRTKSYQKNNISHSTNKTFELYKNSYGVVGIDVFGSVKADARAKLDYRFKRKFKIPYKVRVDFLDSYLNYSFDGSLKLHGKADRTFAGKEFELFQTKIYDEIFWVGPIPVQIDIKTYVRIGTGDLKLSAAGEIGMHKPLNIKGSFNYVCDANNCVRQGESFNNFDESLSAGNVAYQVVAKAEIEPYLNAAVRGRLYWATAYVEVGLQPSVPLKLFGYIGNMCGNGDGLNGNEHVKAGLLTADLRAGVTWKTKLVTIKSDRNYKEFYRGSLAYLDLLNPSSALSPIIRPVVNGDTVQLTTSVRSCISTELDKKFQDFTIYWGNGTSTPLSDVAGSVVKSKSLPQGNYNIKVQHASGAYTQRSITIDATTGGGGDGGGTIDGPDRSCSGPTPPAYCDSELPFPSGGKCPFDMEWDTALKKCVTKMKIPVVPVPPSYNS